MTLAGDTRDAVEPAPAPAHPERAGRNVLVVIGIDRYEHWHQLHNAVSDADGARAQFLALGFEEVVPPLRNASATRAALDELVSDTLVNDPRAALRPDDSLVVFYAGHGGVRTVERNGKPVRVGHLIAVDAATDRFSTWTNLEAWLRSVALLPPRHILVILDACFTGIALSSVMHWRGEEPAPAEPLATLQARPSRRVITSALDNERALDSGPIAGHSLFTGALIEALNGGIAGGGDTVTGSELAMWVRRRVRSFPNAQQTPDFGAFDHDERGEIAIPLRRSARPTGEAVEVETARAASAAMAARPPVRVRRRSRRWLRTLWRERDWLLIAVSMLVAVAIASIGLRC